MNNKLVNIQGWAWDKEKLIVTRNYTWTCPKNIHGNWTSKDGFLTIVDDQWTVHPDMIFDNCSNVPSGGVDPDPNPPVRSLTSKPVYILWRSSIWHDLGYGNIDDKTFPFTRAEIDDYFLINLRVQNYRFAKGYYYGVRIFGGIFHWFNTHFTNTLSILLLGLLLSGCCSSPQMKCDCNYYPPKPDQMIYTPNYQQHIRWSTLDLLMMYPTNSMIYAPDYYECDIYDANGGTMRVRIPISTNVIYLNNSETSLESL